MAGEGDPPVTEHELLSLFLSTLLHAREETFEALIVVAQQRGRDAEEKRLLYSRLLRLTVGVDPCRGLWEGIEAMLDAGNAEGARRLLEAARRRWSEHPQLEAWEIEVEELEDVAARIDAHGDDDA